MFALTYVLHSAFGYGSYCRQATVPDSVDTQQYTVIWRDPKLPSDNSCLTNMRLIDKKTGQASAAQGCTGNIISIINSAECSSEQCIQVNCVKKQAPGAPPNEGKRLVSHPIKRSTYNIPSIQVTLF